MKPLSLDIINASAPYEVYWHEKSRTYRFKSDFGVVLAIGFDDDDIIENAESIVIKTRKRSRGINLNKTDVNENSSRSVLVYALPVKTIYR